MHRILLCLPLCLFLGSDRPDLHPSAAPQAAAAFAEPAKDDAARLAEMERLAKTDPVAMLEQCLRRVEQEVKTGYTLTMQKQENIGGTIHPTESIDVSFRKKPYSVRFQWTDGARLADRVLYVEGENNGKMLARPRGGLARLFAGDVVARDVDGPDARQSGRYTLNEFGLAKSMERTQRSWKAAREEGTLNIEYLGLKKVKEVGDKPCLVLRRINKSPEDGGIKESLIYIDPQTCFQVGIVLKDEKGLLLGSYWFRDIKLNPEFKKDQFTPAALKQ